MVIDTGRFRRLLCRRSPEISVGVDVRQSEMRLVRYDRSAAAGENISLGRVPQKALKAALSAAVKHLNLAGARAAAAVESSLLVVRHTTLPPMPAQEAGPALAYQLPRLIPGYEDSWVHDYIPLGYRKGGRDREREYLVAALPREVALEYHAAFERAGLKLMSLEVRALALRRFLFGARGPAPREALPPCVAVLDPDDITADLAVFENGVPRYIRLLAGWEAGETRERIMERLVTEMEESLLWYREHRGDPPGALMVVCGSATRHEASAALAGRLGLEVYRGKAARPEAEGPALEYAAATGLALRGAVPI